jgi:hypothetical protein
VDVKLHHVGVGVGRRQGGSDAPRRADRAEQIGVIVALVGGLSPTCPAPGPLANLAVLLTDPASSWNQISTGVVFGNPSR